MDKKRILIIYPHFPPSNLAGVHRARLFAQHLPSFGWEPVLLTVHEKYYEETPDYNLQKLLPPGLRIEKVDAFAVTKPRLVGDIGLRGFLQLYKKAKAIIRSEKIDFLYIPIPSFYCALLGRLLHGATGIRYGIDYIDPWVHSFPGSDQVFSRHWLSTRVAKWLEPIAVKHASLITGVAAGYYKGVADRNPHLLGQAVFGAMPYGGEKSDHDQVGGFDLQPYLFSGITKKFQLVYAGAMLPRAYGVLEAIFRVMQQHTGLFADTAFHFIGTGKLANDPHSYNIRPLAEKYGLWESVIFEYPRRIPYLDVLVHLDHADAVFILGSTEPHYTPSKVYQGILAGKPILAVLHQESSAAHVIEEANAGRVLTFNGETDIDAVYRQFAGTWTEFKQYQSGFDPRAVNLQSFEKYSAHAVTKELAELLNKTVKQA